MAAVAIENWHQSNHVATTRPHFQNAPPQSYITTPNIAIPPRNVKEMSRDFLITVLNFFATLVPSHFNNLPLRLVVHGGACMLLHPGLARLAMDQHYLATTSPANSPHNALPRRKSTRDVDYIHRSLVIEWQALGISDATERIKHCIMLTAQHFQLGADWMNSDADVALPMSIDATGKQYDPIYHAALQPNNVHLHSVFTSTNGMLTLVSVPPVWSIVLKLVRYTNFDAGDICLLLRNGVNISNCHWTTSTLEGWIHKEAAPMFYHLWTATKKQELQARIQHAIQMVTSWDAASAQGPVIPAPVDESNDWTNVTRSSSAPPAPQPPPQQHFGRQPSNWAAPPPARASHGVEGQGASPDFEDRWLVPHTRSRSFRPTSQADWHAKYDLEVQKLDRDIAIMLQQSLMAPPGVLPAMEKTSRKKRDKKRSKSRRRDRSSKWSFFVRYAPESDSDSDSDDGRYDNRPVIPGGRSQIQHHDVQPFVPRPSAFHIYASPAAAPPPPPPNVGQSHQSRMVTTHPYNSTHEQSSTVIPFIPPLPPSMASNPLYADQQRSTAVIPFIPPLPRSLASTPYNPDPQPSTSTSHHPEGHRRPPTPYYYREDRRPSTPYRTSHRSHSVSPAPPSRVNELSPLGPLLML
ncbi:hypothetical protein D9615_008586 [Tricholomella constricta]|uniref:Uncharacterized protein n=1 Tax=Tricholomella constricta TaxID=117010 RepID=A0A8H5H434_9AGAR|nr:hypothetical protein D9615_008586 [Tricholomella constricta]